MASHVPRTGPRLRTLIVIAVVVVAGLLGMRHLARMDDGFFGRSLSAARGLAHYLVGDYDRAAQLYRAHLAQWAAAVPASHAWSWTAMARGDLDGAVSAATAELSYAPEHPAPLLTLAEIALARGDLPEALKSAERVLRVSADDYDALLLIAVTRARQGAADAAIDALKRALRYDRVGRRWSVVLSVLELTGELGGRPASARPNCLLA